MEARLRRRSILNPADCHLRRIAEDEDFKTSVEQLRVRWVVSWKYAGEVSLTIESQHAIHFRLCGINRNDGAGEGLHPAFGEDRGSFFEFGDYLNLLAVAREHQGNGRWSV